VHSESPRLRDPLLFFNGTPSLGVARSVLTTSAFEGEKPAAKSPKKNDQSLKQIRDTIRHQLWLPL